MKSAGTQFGAGRSHHFPFQFADLRKEMRQAPRARMVHFVVYPCHLACSLSVCCQSMFAIIAMPLLVSPQRAYLKIMPERVE
jgi:hypothetical protein